MPSTFNKRRKFLWLAALLIVIGSSAVTAWALWAYPSIKAENQKADEVHAQFHVEAGEFDAAREVYEKMDVEETNKAELIHFADYSEGLWLEQQGSYDKAEAIFAGLGNYLDAVNCVQRMEDHKRYQQACSLSGQRQYNRALDCLAEIDTLDSADSLTAEIEKEKEAYLNKLFLSNRNSIAAGAWYTAAAGETAYFAGDESYNSAEVPEQAQEVFSGLFDIIYLVDGRAVCLGSALGARDKLESMMNIVKVDAGINHLLVLTQNGEVAGLGSAAFEKTKFDGIQDVVDIAAGGYHSALLLKDGTVLAEGDNTFGQCDLDSVYDGIALDAGISHTVVLKSDGTVYAAGDNTFGQCGVSGWTDIIAVYCGANFTVGLKKDYTLVAAGDDTSGQCDISGWTDIVSVACGAWHTIGLRADGSLAVTGADSNGQCNVNGWKLFDGMDCASLVAAIAQGVASEILLDDMTGPGPWLYLYYTGAVSIVCDDSSEFSPYRADLFMTKGNLLTDSFAYCDPEMKKRAKPAAVARQNKVIFGQTGDFLSFVSNDKGVMIRRGKVYYDKDDATTMAILPSGTMKIYEKGEITAQELLDIGITDSFAFGPVLVKDGKVRDSFYANNLTGARSWRSAVGMIEPYHFISVVADQGGPMRLKQLAELYADYNVECAYNLDGGNSTAMVFMGEQLNINKFKNRSIGMRNLPELMSFLNSNTIPTMNDPYQRKTRS